MKSTSAKFKAAFTLIELLVVIAIIGILAALAVPALNMIKRGDAIAAATQQLLDDLSYARQLAISRHTTNYMVFVPPGFWTSPGYVAMGEGTNLYDKQYVGYTFVTLRNVGEQPGVKSPDYLGQWRTMPEGTFIATNKFSFRGTPNSDIVIYDPLGSGTIKYTIKSFDRLTAVPFPGEMAYNPKTPNQVFASLPYIAFDSVGRLTSSEDEFIPIARGTIGISRDAQTRSAQAIVPQLAENPPGNSTNGYNVIRIDRLTGRARLEKREVQ